ncbi:Uncharacterised protein [Bordetella pertussis]|nr:Uncharacterised protein [Bordetella pertussis]CFO66939.1 Uncharacterised protein [Bordetella pertussis]CPO17425.1 Uncharacterised protein [Bordetella pertussis]
MEREEAVQGGVGHDVVAADPDRQFRADERDGREQVHDHLGAPVRHLAPGQQIAEEGLAHQTEEDGHAEDPHQLARLAVRAVEQAAQHVQVDHHEEHRGAGGVHVAHQPAPRDFAHDVFNRLERAFGIGLVMHDQENAGHDLDHQHQQCQGAKEIPEIEILRGVVLGQMRLPGGGHREALVQPAQQACRLDGFLASHETAPSLYTWRILRRSG